MEVFLLCFVPERKVQLLQGWKDDFWTRIYQHPQELLCSQCKQGAAHGAVGFRAGLIFHGGNEGDRLCDTWSLPWCPWIDLEEICYPCPYVPVKHQIQVLVAKSKGCWFKYQSWHLFPWARHLQCNCECFSSPRVNGYLWGQKWFVWLI